MFSCFYVKLCKQEAKEVKARISTDLGDPRLLKLLKAEAHEKDTTIREVLITALESYFSHRIENKSLQHASELVFDEWNDPKESDYDQL
jgi:hypothetical protein